MANWGNALLAGLGAGLGDISDRIAREKEAERLRQIELDRDARDDQRWGNRFKMQTDTNEAIANRSADRAEATQSRLFDQQNMMQTKRDETQAARDDRRFQMEQTAADNRMRLQASLSATRRTTESDKVGERAAIADQMGLSPEERKAYALTGDLPKASSSGEIGKVAERTAIADAQGLTGARRDTYILTGGVPKTDDAGQIDPRRARLADDALGFAAQITKKPIEEVRAMTPEQVRDLVANNSKFMSGPVMGRLAPAITNAGAEAYGNAASSINARLANPTGPVSNADFEVARRSGFSSEKPADVNAALIYDALQAGGARAAPQAAPSAPVQSSPAGAPPVGTIEGNHRFRGGNPADPANWEAI